MLTVVSMRTSITFAAGQSNEIGRYEVRREESLPDLGIGVTIDDFQIPGIRQEECGEIFNRLGSKVL